MPVSYQAPAPVAANHPWWLWPGAHQFGLSPISGGMGGFGGGGGGGGGGIQQLHDNTAELENRKELAGIQASSQAELQASHVSAQFGLQQQAAELDAWQFGQKVSTQEQAQMRSDERAISAIDQDPTMSAVEKIQAKTRIKTRIDWVAARQQRDQNEAQTQMMQAHAALFKSQAKLEDDKDAYTAALIGNKFSYVTDPQFVPQLESQVADEMPGVPRSDPNFRKRVDELAQQKGFAHRYFLDKDSKPILDKAYEIDANIRGKQLTDRAAMTEDRIAKHTETIMKELETWKKGLDKPPTPEEESAKLDSLVSTHTKIQNAIRGMEPGEQQRRAKSEERAQSVGTINAVESKIMERDDLTFDQKMAAAIATRKIKHLLNTYNRGDMSPELKRQLDLAFSVLDQLPPAGVSSAIGSAGQSAATEASATAGASDLPTGYKLTAPPVSQPSNPLTRFKNAGNDTLNQLFGK